MEVVQRVALQTAKIEKCDIWANHLHRKPLPPSRTELITFAGDYSLARYWGEAATKDLPDLIYTNGVNVHAYYVFLASASCTLERRGERKMPKT